MMYVSWINQENLTYQTCVLHHLISEVESGIFRIFYQYENLFGSTNSVWKMRINIIIIVEKIDATSINSFSLYKQHYKGKFIEFIEVAHIVSTNTRP